MVGLWRPDPPPFLFKGLQNILTVHYHSNTNKQGQCHAPPRHDRAMCSRKSAWPGRARAWRPLSATLMMMMMMMRHTASTSISWVLTPLPQPTRPSTHQFVAGLYFAAVVHSVILKTEHTSNTQLAQERGQQWGIGAQAPDSLHCLITSPQGM